VVSQIKNHVIDDEDLFITVDLTYDENYNITGFKIFEDDVLSAAYTFDKSIDKPLTALYYGEDGVVEGREECTYDENGNLLTARSYLGDEVLTEAICTYDEHGNVLTKYYDNGEEDWTETYENTYENGVLTEVKIYSHDALQERFLYDSDGNELLHAYYYFGEEGSRYESTYENGKLVLLVEYSDGEETSREEYTYNDNGDLLTQIIKAEGVEHHRQENTYNDAGQLIEIKHLNNDGYSANTVYTYAADGRLESVKAYDEGELELESTFTSEKATVSEEQAKILTTLYTQLIEEWT
jgi:antitoxin component YwqK of YwqJK toxin-antitoxin module